MLFYYLHIQFIKKCTKHHSTLLQVNQPPQYVHFTPKRDNATL